MWTDGQTDTKKLIVVFRHLAEAPNNLGYFYKDFTDVTLYFYEKLISYFHYGPIYLLFSSSSFSAQITDSVIIFMKSSFTPNPNDTALLTSCFWSPCIGIPTMGTPRCNSSLMIRRPPCVTNSFTFGWAVEES